MTGALLRTSGVARLGGRRLLQLYGADASRFVQAIITNDMRTVVAPGDALYGGFLTTKGRLLGDCNVVQTQTDTFLLEYDEGVQDDLLKHWKRYKLRMKVTLEDKSDELAVFATLPASVAPDDLFDYVVPKDELATVLQLNALDAALARGGAIFTDPRGKDFGVRAILPAGESYGYEMLDAAAYNDRRIFLGAAEGKELSDGIPLESNLELLRGVSFRKGCYVGQELTARTQFKGSVRKRFVPLALIPAEHQDLIAKLSALPFQRIDAPSLAPLREFLVSDAARTHASATVEQGAKLLKPGSSKAVGTVLTAGSELSTALAMLRLEHLLPKAADNSASDAAEASPLMQFTTQGGAFHAVPYQPAWWPSVDVATGKMYEIVIFDEKMAEAATTETLAVIAHLVQAAMNAHTAPTLPFVTLTYAQSIDGSIAAVRGAPTLLSGSASLKMTHTLRTLHDAILVGVGTMLADNPSLNARFAEGSNPRPVILDTSLRCPLGIKLFTSAACEKPVILCADTAADEELQRRRRALEGAGATVIDCRTTTDACGARHVDIRHAVGAFVLVVMMAPLRTN
ncbi:hypothetical protein PybrP1_009355 [[Pythium] brassicae (nom. inval.)]|nr:hypothetical protein PybrP1_009355 [[Pythium] brassicae (nom. inval.)]